ncbi:MFS transporter [Longispora urticae]
MRFDRNLVLIIGGAAVSVFGSTLTSIVILFALREHGPFVVAGALLSELLPVALGAPLAGWLVDRFPNRRLMILAQVTQACAVAALAFSLSSVAVVYVLLFLVGCGTAVAGPAASALIPRAAGEERSTAAYAKLGIARTASMLLGATAGGLLVAGPGGRFALLVDAATFVVHAVAMTLVTVERDPAREGTGTKTSKGRVAGFRHLGARRVLLVATVGLALMIVATVLVNVAEVFFLTDVLHVGAAVLGALTACWGVGVIVGAKIAGRLSSGRALLLGLGAGGLAMAAGLVAPSLAPYVAVNAVGWVVAGIGNGMQNVTLQALTRLYTPDELRGRVFAAIGSVLMTANIAGTVSAGLVVAVLGARWVLLAAGLGTAVAAVAVLGYAAVTRAGDTGAPVDALAKS